LRIGFSTSNVRLLEHGFNHAKGFFPVSCPKGSQSDLTPSPISALNKLA